ncbi:MAG: DUF1456 family protein [Gammaproteobacteria bacterium]
MVNNDVLRRLRYALNIGDEKMVEIIKLSGREIDQENVKNLLKKEDEEGYLECDNNVMESFLDGLIMLKRGKSERGPEKHKAPSSLLTNNDILKKLRVAFELKEDGMHEVLALAGFEVSKSELSALFRKKGQKNYRECGDQLLRNFLKGLTLRLGS